MEDQELKDVLGKNIKFFRSLRHLSQADLAEKSNISINFLSHIERGLKWPYPETLVKIARALEIEEFELFQRKKPLIDDTTVLMDRLVKDIAMSVNNSIEKTYKQYCGKKPKR